MRTPKYRFSMLETMKLGWEETALKIVVHKVDNDPATYVRMVSRFAKTM